MRRIAFALLAAFMLVASCGDAADDTAAATDEPTTTRPPTPTTTSTTTISTTTTTSLSTTMVDPFGDFVFGVVLVGPRDDRGWSEAHFEGGRYVEEKLGAQMILQDRVNLADRPETTVAEVVADMIDKGARVVFLTSDDMRDEAFVIAQRYPEVPMILSGGDSAWPEGKDYRPDLANLGNIMGQMVSGKMIAGCAAALTTNSGSIGYLGPLINDETRRLVNSAYLGASHCWTEVLGNDPADLRFEVRWIGFWFYIPGYSLDPTQVASDFFDDGADVVISGIDTIEALAVAGRRAGTGEEVWAVPYNSAGACDEAPDACIGVPFFNWGPSYLATVEAVQNAEFEAQWQWVPPDWDNLDNLHTTGIGWLNGGGLTGDAANGLQDFVNGMADGTINLFTGPLNFQDGSTFLADGEDATDFEIWYTERLLEGIEGSSR